MKSHPYPPNPPFSAHSMIISRRFVSRAGIAALGVLALAACNNDATSPLNVTPDQLQSMGETIATEVESGALGLTAQGVTSTTGGAPSFSRIPTGTAPMFGLAMNRVPVSIARSTTDATCGVASQDPPVVTDGDQVPDNLSISYGLRGCSLTDHSPNCDVTS